MSENHFKYDGNVDSLQYKFEVTGVEFLVPVKIDVSINGRETIILGQMNYLKKELHISDYVVPMTNKNKEDFKISVLDYLNRLTLPEDVFEAPEEVYDEAERAYQKYDNIKEENIGS